MTITYLGDPWLALRDPDTDEPLAGGRVYTFEAGTTNKLTTWVNADKLAENTNPVILDAAGRATIAFDADMKIVVYRSDGSLIDSVDNIKPLTTLPDTSSDIPDVMPEYATVAKLQEATVSVGIKRVRVLGYSAASGFGGAEYVRTDAAPAHSFAVRSVDRFTLAGATDTTNGGWWEVRDNVPINPQMVGGGGPAADAAQQTAALDKCNDADAPGGVVSLLGQTWTYSGNWTAVNKFLDGKISATNGTFNYFSNSGLAGGVVGAGLASASDTGTDAAPEVTITVSAASDAEAIAGTITTKAVTPAALKAAIDDAVGAGSSQSGTLPTLPNDSTKRVLTELGGTVAWTDPTTLVIGSSIPTDYDTDHILRTYEEQAGTGTALVYVSKYPAYAATAISGTVNFSGTTAGDVIAATVGGVTVANGAGFTIPAGTWYLKVEEVHNDGSGA